MNNYLFIYTAPDSSTSKYGWWSYQPNIYFDTTASGSVTGYYAFNASSQSGQIILTGEPYELSATGYSLSGTTSGGPITLHFGYTTAPWNEVSTTGTFHLDFYFDSTAPACSGITITNAVGDSISDSGVAGGIVTASVATPTDTGASVAQVDIYVGGFLFETITGSPWECEINTQVYDNTLTEIKAIIYDCADNYTELSQYIEINNVRPIITPDRIGGSVT